MCICRLHVYVTTCVAALFGVLTTNFTTMRAASAQTVSARLPATATFKLWGRSTDVSTLRGRLAVHGIAVTQQGDIERYDRSVMDAVRAFQKREGLKATGVPRGATIAALNKTPRDKTSLPGAIPPSASNLTGNAVPVVKPAATSVPYPLPRPAALKPAGNRASTPVKAPGATQATLSRGNGPGACVSAVDVLDNAAPMLDENSQLRLREAIFRYEEIVAKGGWSALPERARFTLGEAHNLVVPLRSRLAAEHYIGTGEVGSKTYDAELAAALHRFQRGQGLPPCDEVDGATFAALNIPAAKRLAALRGSHDRLSHKRFSNADLAKRPFVIANIPAQTVQFVEGGKVAASRRAIVGRPTTPSPEVVAWIRGVTFSPTWTLPYSIVRKEIVPALARNAQYLERHSMEVRRHGKSVDHKTVNWKHQDYEVVQRPGVRNSLGQLRIDMPNAQQVYMHDTPRVKLFAAANRYRSHGCVRVQDVVGFAETLLRRTDPTLTAQVIAAEISAHDGSWKPGRVIKLKEPIRVVWIYSTAWVNGDGSVSFRKDVYKRDQPIAEIATGLDLGSGLGQPRPQSSSTATVNLLQARQ